MSIGALIVPRGCGKSRTKGGCYAEMAVGPGGSPIEDFLLDPPKTVDANAVGLSSIGVKVLQDPKSGVWHIFDIVGAKHYPNVADYVEETRRYGMSRRLPKTLDYSKLTPESRMVLLHSRACITNFEAYYKHSASGRWCPCEDCAPPKTDIVKRHIAEGCKECCASLWWEDVEGGEAEGDGRKVRRTMPAFSYDAFRRPDQVKPKYGLAIFAAFPISRIAVVRDPEHKTHEDAAKRARAGKLQVDVEDQ